MNYQEIAKNILKEIDNNLISVDENQVNEVVNEILKAKRIFVSGAGRSGLMIKTFAMRLMHMGLTAYVVSEIVTPAFKEGDLLMIASGSGETQSLIAMANKVKKLNGKIVLFTIHKDSNIGKLADDYVVINGLSFKTELADTATSIQPIGSLFEQSLFVTFEAIVILLMKKLNLKNEDMIGLHANLE